MLSTEMLIRAAEGSEREAELVRADFQQVGLEAWVRDAIARRLDPALGARVVPAGQAAAVSGALEAFYALWGRWCPSEYRRVRREWLVLRARWHGDAPVDPPPQDQNPATSQLLSNGTVNARSSVVPEITGEVETELKPLEAAASHGARTGPAPGAAMEKDSSGAPGCGAAGGKDASSPHGGAPLDGVGGSAAERPGDNAEVFEGDGGLPLSDFAHRLDEAVRSGKAAVEEVRAAWLTSSETWHRWPQFGRRQERSR